MFPSDPMMYLHEKRHHAPGGDLGPVGNMGGSDLGIAKLTAHA